MYYGSVILTVLRTVFTIPKNIIQEALQILHRSIFYIT